MADVDGILVPGGFGPRGVEGKIAAVKYARENKVPFFGICLGMHMMVIEFARHIAGLAGANSTEMDPDTPYPVIYLMNEWYDYRTKQIERRNLDSEKGGTMRLGAYPCHLADASKAYQAYKQSDIMERHRHRYEFNNQFRETFAEKGMIYAGMSPNGELVEIVELGDHPWFLGCQFHPEFKSRPMDPHPLFADFIQASLKYKEQRRQS
jgi:CTP synthase